MNFCGGFYALRSEKAVTLIFLLCFFSLFSELSIHAIMQSVHVKAVASVLEFGSEKSFSSPKWMSAAHRNESLARSQSFCHFSIPKTKPEKS